MIADRSLLQGARAPSLKALAACLLAAALGACAGGPEGPSGPDVAPGRAAQPLEPEAPPAPAPLMAPTEPAPRGGLTPAFMAGRPIERIGILLPFSTGSAEARSLYEAAELALFDHGDSSTLLIPRDSGAAAASAQAAGQTLLGDGADVIIGPISKDQVAALSGAARGAHVPVIAFSTDATVAGNGIYLLTYPFEEEIHRIVDYASRQGVRRFAILAPDTEYGRRVDVAFREEVSRQSGAIVAALHYPRTDKDAAAAALTMAAQARAAGAQALLIPENGAPLRAIGQTLLQASFDTKHIKLLGASLWASDAQREPSLAGGWYAAPDPALRAAFEARYRAAYNHPPSRLASLAYDAVAVSETLARDGAPLTAETLQRPDGFLGADGVFRFKETGTVQRGLAVLEVRPGTPAVIDPAPTALAARGF